MGILRTPRHPRRWKALANDLIRPTARYLPSVIAPIVTQLATLVVLARVLNPQEFGVVTLAQAAANLLVLATASWAASAVLQFLSAHEGAQRAEYHRHISLAVWAQVLSTALIGILLSIVLPPPANEVVLDSLIAGLPAALLVVPLYALRTTNKAAQFNLLSLARHVLPTVIGLLSVMRLARTAETYQVAYGLALLALVPGSLWAARTTPAAKNRAHRRVSSSIMRRLLRFALPLAPAYLLNQVLAFVDRFIIAGYLGAAEAGKYSAGYSLASFPMQFIVSALLVACGPEIVRAWESGGIDAASRITRKWTSFNFVLTGGTVIFLFLAIDWLQPIVFGANFGDVSSVVRIVALGEFIIGMQVFFQRPLMFLEQTREILSATAIATLANVGLNLAFVPRYGAIAAAWATLLTNSIYTISIVRRTRKAVRRRSASLVIGPAEAHPATGLHGQMPE